MEFHVAIGLIWFGCVFCAGVLAGIYSYFLRKTKEKKERKEKANAKRQTLSKEFYIAMHELGY